MDESKDLNNKSKNTDDIGSTMNEIENLISYLQTQNNVGETKPSKVKGNNDKTVKSSASSNNTEFPKKMDNSVRFSPLSDDILEPDNTSRPATFQNKPVESTTLTNRNVVSDKSAITNSVLNRSAEQKSVRNGSVISNSHLENGSIPNEYFETRPVQNKPIETRQPVRNKPAETRPVSNNPVETRQPVRNKPVETRPVSNNPVETRPVQNKPIETRQPVRNKPAETRPVSNNPVETRPVQNKPIETRQPVRNKPSEDRFVSNKPVETGPVRNKPSEDRFVSNKPVETGPVRNKPSEDRFVSNNSEEDLELEIASDEVSEYEENLNNDENIMQLVKKRDDNEEKSEKIETITIGKAVSNEPIIISVKDLLFYMIKNIYVFALFIILSCSCSYIITEKLIQPEYISNTKIIIFANEQEDADNITSLDDMQFNIKLMSDCSQIIKSRDVLEIVIDELDLDISYEDLYERITVQVTDNSRIVDISVKYNDPIMTVKVLGKLQEVSLQSMKDNLEVTSAKVIQYENLPHEAVFPSLKNNIVFGTVIGVALAVVIIFFFYIDDIKKKKNNNINHK